LPPEYSDRNEAVEFIPTREFVIENVGKPVFVRDAGQRVVLRLRTAGYAVDSAAPLPYLLLGLPPNQNNQEFVES
jgi:hypothetical protein